MNWYLIFTNDSQIHKSEDGAGSGNCDIQLRFRSCAFKSTQWIGPGSCIHLLKFIYNDDKTIPLNILSHQRNSAKTHKLGLSGKHNYSTRFLMRLKRWSNRFEWQIWALVGQVKWFDCFPAVRTDHFVGLYGPQNKYSIQNHPMRKTKTIRCPYVIFFYW